MNIFDRIKQLKLIEPEAGYAERSKRDIFAAPAPIVFPRLTVRQVLVRIFEAGVATGLVALFLLLITGNIAVSPLKPVPFAAINPASLHAEAQAIDIQIKLTNMAYQASQVQKNTTTPASTVASAASVTAAITSGATTTAAIAAASSSAATSSLSVDQVLNALSQ